MSDPIAGGIIVLLVGVIVYLDHRHRGEVKQLLEMHKAASLPEYKAFEQKPEPAKRDEPKEESFEDAVTIPRPEVDHAGISAAERGLGI